MTIQDQTDSHELRTNGRKGVNLSLLVSQIISKNDASQVCSIASELSRVSVAEYEMYRSQLKEHFKQHLYLRGLDRAVKEARKSRKLAELAIKRASQKKHTQERMVVEVGGHLRDVVNSALDALVYADRGKP